MSLFISYKDLTHFVDVCNTFVFDAKEAERNACAKFLAYKTKHHQAIIKCLQLILDTNEREEVQAIFLATQVVGHYHKGNWPDRLRKLLILIEYYLSKGSIPEDSVKVVDDGLIFGW